MIGDLQQLTPVVTPADEQLLKPYYDTPYFFSSKALAQTDYVTIQLDKAYRQQDEAFIDILNHIREGQPSGLPQHLQRTDNEELSVPIVHAGQMVKPVHSQHIWRKLDRTNEGKSG